MSCNGRLRRLQAKTLLIKLLKTNNFTSLSTAARVWGINKGLLSVTLQATRDPGPTVCQLLDMPLYEELSLSFPETLEVDVNALTDLSAALPLVDCAEPWCSQKFYRKYWQEKRCYPCRRGTKAALVYASENRVAISDIYGERITVKDVRQYLQDSLQPSRR